MSIPTQTQTVSERLQHISKVSNYLKYLERVKNRLVLEGELDRKNGIFCRLILDQFRFRFEFSLGQPRSSNNIIDY